MIEPKIKESNCKDRKEYLIKLAIEYIKSHTGYIGINDEIMYDGCYCDGYTLAADLSYEFDIDNNL